MVLTKVVDIYRQGGVVFLIKKVFLKLKNIMRLRYWLLFPFAYLVSYIGSNLENTNTILFGTRSGRGFEDNSKYIYNDLINEEGFKPIWNRKSMISCPNQKTLSYGEIQYKEYISCFVLPLGAIPTLKQIFLFIEWRFPVRSH
jgi:hypothetical protein